jgi:3'(2'), 5'-bisphosphate nucleotidase
VVFSGKYDKIKANYCFLIMDQDLLKQLQKVVREAGQAILPYYHGEIANEIKEKIEAHKTSPFTEADLLAEKIILAGLQPYGYGILSEETKDSAFRLSQERVWLIDPLDGTKDFIQQTGEFTIMVGLAEKGKVILGVVYWPTADKLYYATQGGGAFCQQGSAEPVPLQVSQLSDLSPARLLVSRNHLMPAEQQVAQNAGITKLLTCGSAGLKICRVAVGEADLYLQTSDKTSEWDCGAADIILTEAGGRLTDKHGRELVYNRQNPINLDGFVASNGFLHEQAIAGLAKVSLNQ